MHCCILKCTFPQYISSYRAREMVVDFVEPVLEEFNYLPPEKEVQDYIVKYFGSDCSLTKEIKTCMYLSEAQAIKSACVRAEWKPFDSTQKLDKKEKKSLKRRRCDSSMECAICLYECEDSVRLNCDHDFCYKCIKQWLSIKRKCPVCDADVNFEKHKQRKRLKLPCKSTVSI